MYRVTRIVCLFFTYNWCARLHLKNAAHNEITNKWSLATAIIRPPPPTALLFFFTARAWLLAWNLLHTHTRVRTQTCLVVRFVGLYIIRPFSFLFSSFYKRRRRMTLWDRHTQVWETESGVLFRGACVVCSFRFYWFVSCVDKHISSLLACLNWNVESGKEIRRRL